jgi:Protein of unknown function (DUF2628)
MAKLAIYMNEAGKSVLHRTGFSWAAAIVPPIWALQHRLYKTCVATFAVNILLPQAIALMPNGAPQTGVQIGWALFQLLGAGFGANLYHRVVLERSGYFMTSAEPGRLKGGA